MIETKPAAAPRQPGRTANIVLWVLQVLMAIVFILGGTMKLAGNPEAAAMFDQIGLGRWFLYFTGIVELGSGSLLLIPSLAAVGALLLMCTMLCAAAAHLFVVGGSPAGALAFLAVNTIIFWFRRTRLRTFRPTT